MTSGFDVRWGDTVSVSVDRTRESEFAPVPYEIVSPDLIFVPGRGQPRVFLASWFASFEQTLDMDIQEFFIDFFIGVGQTNIRRRADALNANSIEFPAETVRANFIVQGTALENPRLLPRVIKATVALVIGPYFPFSDNERQQTRGGY